MRKTNTSKSALVEFDSVNEVAERVKEAHASAPTLSNMNNQPEWYGPGITSMQDVYELARVGWDEKNDEWLKIAEDTLESIERAFEVPSWSSHYDVTGSDVDVSRYLNGEPENMIQFDLVQSTKVGRVVSLAINIVASAMVKAETIEARGKSVMALVFALERIGIRTEIYADMQVEEISWHNNEKTYGRVITKVKDAGETLDPAMVSFALAHAAFFRAMVMPAMHEFPQQIKEDLGVGSFYGTPTNDMSNEGVLPEGTIQIESAMRGRWDNTKAEDFVVKHLKELGMISD